MGKLLWQAALAAAVLGLCLILTAPTKAQLAGPQFLERSSLAIPQDRLLGTAGGRGWVIEVVNAQAAQTLRVQLRITGAIADALSVSGPDTVQVLPGQTASFRIVRGARPHTGTGELVIIAPGGVDRRPVMIERAGSPLTRHSKALLAWLVPFLVVGSVTWLLLGKRKRRMRPIPSAPSPATLDEVSLQSHPSFVHSDEPTLRDRLDRREYAEQLTQLAEEAEAPLVVGVFGEWGSGKTSLLAQVHARLAEGSACAVAWFDAWKYQFDDNPMLPLLHAVVNDLGLESELEVRRTLKIISETLGGLSHFLK